jgi:hypothetical protein
MYAIHPRGILLVVLAVVFGSLVFLLSYWRSKRRHTEIYKNVAVAPKRSPVEPHAVFVDLSPKSADIVELAVEVWRINNRLIKAGDGLSDTQKRGLESSLQKFIKFLDRFNVKFIDHTGQKYNEGMSVEVLSFENDQTAKYPFIKETVEPSVVCDGMVVKKGKVVVVNN